MRILKLRLVVTISLQLALAEQFESDTLHTYVNSFQNRISLLFNSCKKKPIIYYLKPTDNTTILSTSNTAVT